MSRILLVLAVLPLSLLLFVAGQACSNNDKETKAEYEAKVERELNQVDARIQELDTKIEQSTADERAQLKEESARLKDERETVRQKLEELRAANEDDWKRIKDDLDGTISSMNDRANEALERLRN